MIFVTIMKMEVGRILRLQNYFGGPEIRYSLASGDWKVLFPPPISGYSLSHGHTLNDLRQFATDRSVGIEKTGQQYPHFDTMNFLLERWEDMVDQLHPTEKKGHEVFCIPEVSFSDRGPMVDCIGSDPSGIVYVVEIGTRRKNSQLKRGVQTVRSVFPELFVIGLRAYHDIHKNNRKIYLSWIEG